MLVWNEPCVFNKRIKKKGSHTRSERLPWRLTVGRNVFFPERALMSSSRGKPSGADSGTRRAAHACGGDGEGTTGESAERKHSSTKRMPEQLQPRQSKRIKS